ncbi:TniQ protein [Octadecabacter temperatus]|nr:TniQ protein [Octadecabacter temperatus]
MSRLAARNGVSSRLLGLNYDMPFKSVVDGEITAIRTLSALGSVNPEQVAKWTASHRNRSSHRLCGETFHGMSVRNPVIKGCPLCLKEDAQDHTRPPEQAMALRGHWMVKHVFLCMKHRHPLVPLWRESNLILRYDTSQRFTDHAAALVQGDFDQETREFTDYDQWIDNRLENGRADGWLDQHPLHAGATFCFLLGYALLRLEISAPSSIPREDRWAIYQTGYEVARKGESAIRKSLQKLQQRTATPQQGPKATFPLLYERLAHDYATDPDFMPFRDILRSHILETWPLGVGDELMGDPVERRQLHSVITASKETGVDQRRLRKLLEARKLISPEQPDAWALFDAEDTSHLLASLVTYLPAKNIRGKTLHDTVAV